MLVVGVVVQAEDGIRDSPWSGGVGDVDKRQVGGKLIVFDRSRHCRIAFVI